MSDPLRTDNSRALDPASGGDRDARIEQLLLLGLDHYFAGDYEQAIHVWTRTLFFDRSHPRARAYIERARSALAERQRRSEELLQNGLAALNRGEADEVRQVLRTADDGGGATDEAIAPLHRVDCLDHRAGFDGLARSRVSERGGGMEPNAAGRGRRSRAWAGWATAAVLLVVAGIGALTSASWTGVDWQVLLPLADDPATAITTPAAPATVLPLPRRGEMALVRARSLTAGGHLFDALIALDAVRPTDPQRQEADRLRAEIQRQLLGLTSHSVQAQERRDKLEVRLP